MEAILPVVLGERDKVFLEEVKRQLREIMEQGGIPPYYPYNPWYRMCQDWEWTPTTVTSSPPPTITWGGTTVAVSDYHLSTGGGGNDSGLG